MMASNTKEMVSMCLQDIIKSGYIDTDSTHHRYLISDESEFIDSIESDERVSVTESVVDIRKDLKISKIPNHMLRRSTIARKLRSKEEINEQNLKLKNDLFLLNQKLSDAEMKINSSRASMEMLRNELNASSLQNTKEKHILRQEVMELQQKLSDCEKQLQSSLDSQSSQQNELDRLRMMSVDQGKQRVAIEELTTQNQQLHRDLVALTQLEQQTRRQTEDMKRLNASLQSDKAFLQQEVQLIQQRFEEKSRTLDGCQSKALSMELRLSQLTDQLLNVQMNSRTGFDERMEREITRIREESMKEMESLRSTSRDLLDRETRVLKEAKLALEYECDQLRRRNDALGMETSQMQRDWSNSMAEKNRDLAELRAEFKMKSFELSALGVSYEERMSLHRQLELEAELLRKEVSVQRSSLLRMESEHANQVRMQSQEMEAMRSKLNAYEVLESEIDEAVLRAGELAQPGNPSDRHDSQDDDWIDHHTRNVFRSIGGVPLKTERRVRQAVQLAQRLLTAEGRIQSLTRQVNELQVSLAETQEKERIAKEDLHRSSQPTAYLVGKLRDEETAKYTLLSKCKRLEEELVEKQRRFEALSMSFDQLKRRLELLLNQRGELETTRQLLQAMQQREEEAAALEREGEESLEEFYHSDPEDGGMDRVHHDSMHGLTTEDVVQEKDKPKTFGLSAELIKIMTTPPIDRTKNSPIPTP